MAFSHIVILIMLALMNDSTVCQEDQGPIETKECRERERLVTSDRDDLYSLVDALDGQTLILRCRFCNEEHSDQPKNWYKVDQLGIGEPHEVKLDMDNDVNYNRVRVNHKHSLIISNFSMVDMGFYYCVHFEDKTNDEKYNYLVDIVFLEKSTSIETGSVTDWAKYHDDYFKSINALFKESEALEFIYLRDILKVDAEMASQWAPWGPCQACGRPQGEAVMKKRGSCRIKLRPYDSEPKNLTAEEMYLSKAPAISCRSKLLRKVFSHISNYTSIVPDFILEDRCSSICNPDAEGVNKGWKVGKGKGFKYRKHAVLQENSHLTFVCPESSLDNKVVWKKNGRVLKRGDNSDPHVIVDTFNTLYLVEVTRPDAGNYTCYVDDTRMQQIVIFVHRFILFLSSFCYCAGLVIAWQRRYLFKSYEELKREDPKKKEEELENLI